MAAEASFLRKDTKEGVVFEVQPARGSIAQVIAIIFVSLWLMGSCVGMTQGASSSTASWVMSALLLFLAPFWVYLFRDRSKRHQVTIVANRDGMVVGDQFYPINDIAEFQLDNPTGEVVHRASPIVVGTGLGGVAMGVGSVAAGLGNATVAIGAEIGRRQANRSLSLRLRRKSSSKPIQIVYGLTIGPGRALMNDLIDALAKAPEFTM